MSQDQGSLDIAGSGIGATLKLESTATITAGNTRVTVTHNKNTTPKYILPTGDLTGFSHWLENVTANTFDIVIGSPLISDIIFRYGV